MTMTRNATWRWGGETNLYRVMTLALFCIVILTLLVQTDFLPYGTDNNETFSSILHARNIYLQGLTSFFGLTNETTSLAPAAQAYVYTHQGNFPRFYALLLYVLGARSPEAQIFITTFTVGLAGIMFAHLYMEKRANPLFAFIFCAVLITDYMMSLQWIVNTWRVWHLFFFFSSLLLAHGFANQRMSRSQSVLVDIGLFVNFACLFYLELVFAAYVAIFFGLYLGFLLWREPKRLIFGWVVAGLGGLSACAVLVLQIVGYMGWQNFLTDFRFTFMSRNASPDDLLAFKESVQAFMREHNLVFWDNFIFGNTDFRKPVEFVKLFFYYSFLMQAPMLMIILLIAAGGWTRTGLVALDGMVIRSRKSARWLGSRVRDANAAAVLVPLFVLFECTVVVSSTSYGITAADLYLMPTTRVPFLLAGVLIASASVLFVHNIYRQLGTSKLPGVLFLLTLLGAVVIQFYMTVRPPINVLVFVFLLLVMAGFAVLLWLFVLRNRPTNLQVGVAAVFLILFSGFSLIYPKMYELSLTPVAPNYFEKAWLDVTASLGGHTIWKIVIVASGLFGVLTLFGIFDVNDAPATYRLSGIAGVLPYAGLGFLAYAIVYMIAPGYIFTAYQNRSCPFAVYVADIPVAIALYLLGIAARQSLRRTWVMGQEAVEGRFIAQAASASVCTLLVACVGSWLTIQAFLVQRLPPDRLALLFHALERIAGHTTVVSTYAAPVAIETGAWSYFDPVFFTEQWSNEYPTDAVTPHDYRYLWFADRASNESYRQPEYFICLVQLSFYNIGSKSNWSNCGQLEGIREIREGDSFFAHREVARDEKYDIWSIVKLDWGNNGFGR